MAAAMKKYNISLTDSEGQMKSLDTVIRELRTVFQGLSQDEQAALAATLANKTGMAGLLSIMNTTTEEYDKMSGKIKNSSGALDEMTAKMKDNMKFDFTVLKSSVEGLALSFGSVLEPKVRSFLQTATGMVNSFSGMSDWSKNLLIDITGLGLGIGATLKIIGTVKSVMGSFKLGMVATDIGNVSGAIQMMGFKLTGLSTALGISTLAAAGLIAIFGGVALAVGGAIYWFATADKRLAEFNSNLVSGINESQEKVKQSQENVKTAKQALAEIQRLENEIARTSNTEERTTKEQELLDKKKELLTLFPELREGFGDEASAIDGVINSTENLIKKQEELIAIEKRKQADLAREYFTKKENKDAEGVVKGVQKSKQEIADLKGQLEEISQYSDDDRLVISTKNIDGSINNEYLKISEIRDKLNKQLVEANDELDTTNASLQEQKNMYQALVDNGEILTDGEKERFELVKNQLESKEEYIQKTKLEDSFGVNDAKISITADPQKVKELSEQTRKLLADMESADEIVQNSLGNMVNRLEQGFITTTQFEQALNSYANASSFNFGALEGNISLAMDSLLQKVSLGTLGFDDFNSAMDAMAMYSSESMATLSDSSKKSMEIMLSSLNSGQIKAGDFQSAVSTYMSYAENDFIGLDQVSQDAMNKIVQHFSNGEISAEQYQTAMGMMSAYVDTNFQKLPQSAQTAMGTLKTQFNNGEINANQFAQGVGKALGLTESDLASLAGASASDIGSLISDLLSGKVNANNLQGAIAALQSKKITVTTEFKEIGQRPGGYVTKGGNMAQLQSLPMLPDAPVTQPPIPTIDTYSVSPMTSTPSPTSESTPTATPMASGDSSSSSTSPVLTSTPTVSTYANNSFTNVWDKDPYEGMSDDAKKQAQDRVKAEEDAKRAILALRNDLYKALKNKIEKQKKDELDTYDKKLSEIKKKYDEQKSYEESIYDARIDVIKKEMELLDKSVNPSKEDNLKEEEDKLKEYQKTLSKLEAEKEKWLKNDSAMGREQAKKIQTQIDEQNKVIEDQQKAVAKAEVDLKKEKLQENIDLLEEEKKQTLENMEKQQEATIESVENEKQVMLDKYEQLLSDEALYLEANKMMQKNNMDDILKMLTEFAPDFSDIGILLGKSLAEAMSGEIKKGVDGWDYIKNPNNKPTTPSNPSPSPSPTPTLPEPEPPKQEDKPKKGKITASGLNVRSGAGTNNKILDSVYRNDEVDIIESKDGWYYVDYYSKWRKKRDKGWVSGNYVQPTFHTGGVIGDMDASSGIAIVKSKERVLTESQNRVFEGLVYDWIPKLERMFSNIPSTNNIATTNGLTYNSTYNVVNHTDFDANNMEDNILYNLKKQMKSMGKRF